MTLLASQIKDVSFEETNETMDDSEPLYEGTLTITLNDGSQRTIELDWVRAGHYHDFLSRSRKKRIEAVVDYQECYDKHF